MRSYSRREHVSVLCPNGGEQGEKPILLDLCVPKLLEDLDSPLHIRIFIGDGHHNAMGIYRYLKEKGIIPIIPLHDDSQPTPSEASTSPKTTPPEMTQKNMPVTPRPQIDRYPDITFDLDGTPLCPGNCRMRHQAYNTKEAAHIFACPCTRKNGKQEWVFHTDECPFHEDCTPKEKKMGHTLYIKSEVDLRLFPPIPRESKHFKDLYAHRSGTERQNSVADSYQVDRRHRNATYTLIRLTFVTICKHARIRQKEGGNTTPRAHLHQALAQLNVSSLLPN